MRSLLYGFQHTFGFQAMKRWISWQRKLLKRNIEVKNTIISFRRKTHGLEGNRSGMATILGSGDKRDTFVCITKQRGQYNKQRGEQEGPGDTDQNRIGHTQLNRT